MSKEDLDYLHLQLELLRLSIKSSQLTDKYEKEELEKFEQCNHFVIPVYDYMEDVDSHHRVFYGCIKCGLHNNKYHSGGTYNNAMEKYLKKHFYEIPGDYYSINGESEYKDKYILARNIYEQFPDVSNDELKKIIDDSGQKVLRKQT